MQTHNNVKQLPESERPYEKFLTKGADFLSDAELLAIILKTGTKEATSVELARTILQGNHGNLLNLYDMSFEELTKISGIGTVKAIQLKAVAELSIRIAATRSGYQLQMGNPMTIANYFMERLRHENKEHLICALFDANSNFLGDAKISVGSVSYAYVSPRDIFQFAFQKNAVYLVLLHNHPSGNPKPSDDDVRVTKRVSDGAELLGIHLADHIIIGDNTYFSFRENNYI